MPRLRVEPGSRIAGPPAGHLRTAQHGGSTHGLGFLEGAPATDRPPPCLLGGRPAGSPEGRRPDFGAGASGGRMGFAAVRVFNEPVDRADRNEHELSASRGSVAARPPRREAVARNPGRERVAVRIAG